VNPLEIKYEYPNVEIMLREVTELKNRYLKAEVPFEYNLFIGYTEYYCIFVLL
jgi:hypothetical protein